MWKLKQKYLVNGSEIGIQARKELCVSRGCSGVVVPVNNADLQEGDRDKHKGGSQTKFQGSAL